MSISWASGDHYEQYMGRWSRLVAGAFLAWLSPVNGLRWLDVGCGSGALSEAIARDFAPGELTALDQSAAFAATTRERLSGQARVLAGDAMALPLPQSAVDVTVSGLVLNFILRPDQAVADMRRVTAPGGMVGVYIWDYTGTMDLLTTFWSAAVTLDPAAANQEQSRRFPDATAEALQALFETAGLSHVRTTPIVIDMIFRDFEDYWRPFLGGTGPAPTYVQSLDLDRREVLRRTLETRLPVRADRSIHLKARAWAARGQS
jgi:ubiquinone/menaquinone biosynthesis C-methylase UbiE